MAWRINRDYLADQDRREGRTPLSPSAVGKGCGIPVGETFTFRCLDDDQEVYYHGVADQAAIDLEDETDESGWNEHPESLYAANKWAENDAGALWLEVKAKDGIRVGLLSQEYCDKQGYGPDDWVSIYS